MREPRLPANHRPIVLRLSDGTVMFVSPEQWDKFLAKQENAISLDKPRPMHTSIPKQRVLVHGMAQVR